MDIGIKRLLAVAGVLALAGSATGQTLVGDTVALWKQPQLTGVAVLDSFAIVTSPLAEFVAMNDDDTIYTVNIEASSIRLDSRFTFYSPYFNSGFEPTYMEIRGLNFIGEPERYISGVSVSFSDQISIHDTPPANWPQFSASNVTFTADSVRISYGGYTFPRDSFVQIDLITTVPTPGGAAMVAMLSVLGASRRRRSGR